MESPDTTPPLSPKDVVLVDKLFEDYTLYRELTAFVWNLRENVGARNTRPKKTDEKLAVLAAMVVWCRGQGVEPRLWLFSLFSGRSWKYPPKLEGGHLCSKKMLEKYANTRGLGFFRKRVMASRDDDITVDPNVDIIPSVEGRKAGYQSSGQAVRCREETALTTLGYHPRSSTCLRCPEAHRCAVDLASRMPFDIIALREGRLSAADAERFAREGEQ